MSQGRDKNEVRALQRKNLKHRKFEAAYARYVAIKDFIAGLPGDDHGQNWTRSTLLVEAEKLRPALDV